MQKRFPIIKENFHHGRFSLRRLGRFDFPHAQEEAYRKKGVIAPNRSISFRDSNIDFPCVLWTGTALIYEAPDVPFRSDVSVSISDPEKDFIYSISCHIPQRYRGKKNCALAVEFPDFWIATLGYLTYELNVLEHAALHLIEDFPSDNGSYLFDQRFHIPYGTQKAAFGADLTMQRSLFRMKTAFVAPIMRIAGRLWPGDFRDLDVYADQPVCNTCEVYRVSIP